MFGSTASINRMPGRVAYAALLADNLRVGQHAPEESWQEREAYVTTAKSVANQRIRLAMLIAGIVWLAGAMPTAAAPTAPSIVGGDEAAKGAWPWAAALVNSNSPDAFDGQFCGGSLVHAEWVLTAAHCVYEGGHTTALSAIDVVVGRHQLSSDEGERIAVQEIFVHPSYNQFSNDYDLALLKLAQPASVSTVALARLGDESLMADGTPATVLGWGHTAYGGASSDVLRQVTVPVVPQQSCQEAYGAGAITDNMLCAGTEAGGKDSCQGDSGGPLIVLHADENWRQIGVVSWGSTCAEPLYPGVYARVPSGFDWVASLIPDLDVGAPLPEGTPVYLPVTRKSS